MKKHKKKNYLIKLLLLLFFTAIFITSCMKDFEQDTPVNNSEIVFNKIKLDEFVSKEKLKKSLNILSKKFDVSKNNTLSKNITAKNGSFTLLTDDIIEAISDTITIYTFLIETPTDSTSTFENFVIKQTENDLFFGIFKYQLNNKLSANFPYELTIQDVNENQINLEDFDAITKEMPTLHWADGCLWVWYASGDCDDCGYYHREDCITGGSGWTIGGNNEASDNDGIDVNIGIPGHDTTSGGSTSNTSNSDSSSTGTNFAPAIGVIKNKTDNCGIFNDLVQDQPMKDLINTLKGMTNLNTETGLALTKNADGTYSAIQGVPNAKNEIEFNIPNGTTIDYIIHTHYTGGLSIFSAQDIQTMYNIVTNGNITTSQEFVSIVVTPNNDVYALSLQNRNAFINFGNTWLSQDILFRGFDQVMTFKGKGNFNINRENINSNNEKNFIKMLQKRQMSIQIHKANADDSEWSRLTINPMTNEVTPTPCN